MGAAALRNRCQRRAVAISASFDGNITERQDADQPLVAVENGNASDAGAWLLAFWPRSIEFELPSRGIVPRGMRLRFVKERRQKLRFGSLGRTGFGAAAEEHFRRWRVLRQVHENGRSLQ
jgi:hypothetical protein